MTAFEDFMDSAAIWMLKNPYDFLFWLGLICLPLLALSAYLSMRLVKESKQV